MGRKTSLNQGIIDRIAECIRAGLPRERARDYGIDPEAPELMRAESDFVMACLMKINAGVANWRAYAWMLETRFPDEYGPNRENTDDDGGSPENYKNVQKVTSCRRGTLITRTEGRRDRRTRPPSR